MGLNEFLVLFYSRIAAGFKKHVLFELVNSQVLAFLLGFKLYLLLQQAESGCISSFCSLSDESFPPETSTVLDRVCLYSFLTK